MFSSSTSFPELPSRCYNPFTDQLSDDFIHDRLIKLTQFLSDLVKIAKIRSFPLVLTFLGLDESSGDVLANCKCAGEICSQFVPVTV